MKKASTESFQETKHRHKRQQALYDAIKLSRAGGEAFATFHGKRFQLFQPGDMPCFTGFVKLGGRVRLCWVVEKDGLRAITLDRSGVATGSSVHVSGSQILCAASEIGDRSPTQG